MREYDGSIMYQLSEDKAHVGRRVVIDGEEKRWVGPSREMLTPSHGLV